MADKDLLEKVYNRALRFLAYRPRSPAEIEIYLSKKFDLQAAGVKLAIKQVLRRLKAQKLISEVDFVDWWLEQRAQFRPKGKIILKQELRQKGIDRELIERALAKVDEVDILRGFYQSKLIRKQALIKDQRRLGQYLLRRGFNWQNIKTLIDEIAKKA